MSASDDFSNSNSLIGLNNNMPTKLATCCERKAVFVTVYIEKPRRRMSSNNHHHLHRSIKQELIGHKNGVASKGCNRRTELLHYCQSLRESARSSASTALQYSKPVSSIDHHKQSSNKVRAVQRRATDSRSPACFDKWRILVPRFFRSLTNLQAKKTGKKNNGGSSSNKINAVMKIPQMQKKWRFFSKPISMLHKNQKR